MCQEINNLVFNPTISGMLATGAVINLVEVNTGANAGTATALSGSAISGTPGMLSIDTQNTVDAADLTYVGVTYTVTLNGVTSDPMTLDISSLFGAGSTADKLRTDKAKLSGGMVLYSNADGSGDVAIPGKTMSVGVAMAETQVNGDGSITGGLTIRAAAGGNIILHFNFVYTVTGDTAQFSDIPLTCNGTTCIARSYTGINSGWTINILP